MPSASFQLNSTDATVIDMGDAIAQIAQLVSASAGASPPTAHVARKAIGPVFGAHKAAYYGTLAGVLAVVALEMVTAYWLPRAGVMLVSFANGLVRLAVVLFLILIAVGGYGLTIKA